MERFPEKPELPCRGDFYFSKRQTFWQLGKNFLKTGKLKKEIPLEFAPLARNFLKEVWANNNYLFEDKKRVVYALKLAVEAHKGQVRRERDCNGNPLPYVVHPLEAAFMALRRGQSASFLIWLLLHDTMEDTWIKYENRNFVRELFRGTVTETVVRKLSRYRREVDPKTGEVKFVKIEDPDYADQLRSSHSAVKAKHFDTLSSIKADGRRLDSCLDLPVTEAREVISNIRRFISQVVEFLIPIEKDFYCKLAEETELFIGKVETRIQIVEAFLAQNKAGYL